MALVGTRPCDAVDLERKWCSVMDPVEGVNHPIPTHQAPEASKPGASAARCTSFVGPEAPYRKGVWVNEVWTGVRKSSMRAPHI